MIDFTLTRSRAKRYRYAAEHLASCARLAADIPDFGAFETHDAYVARLKEAHGRKFGFWSLTAARWSCYRKIRSRPLGSIVEARGRKTLRNPDRSCEAEPRLRDRQVSETAQELAVPSDCSWFVRHGS